jgi:dolichol-phosphate mannosyltransferase
MSKDFSIIIPTYNERDSISPLLERIDQELSGLSYEVIFIDDNSKDGTPELINSLSGRYPVRVVVRHGKKGLATAVADGFGQATTGTIVVMDADLQHPPEIIPSLLQAIRDGADIAIASRYVQGGGNEGWSKTRQIISNGAILLSHLLLPSSRQVKDPMSGFFAVKRDILTGLKLEPIGYKILLEVITLAKNARISEVPFMFQIREKGKSKLNTSQQIEYLKHLFSLMRRSGELARFFKFALVGISGVGVNTGIYWLLTRVAGLTGSLDLLAVVIAAETSIITNFILNNYFTFADRHQKGFTAFLSHWLRFNLVSLVGVAIQMGVFFVFTRYLGFSAPLDILALFIAIIIAMMWNFLSNNWWTWKK